MAAGKRPVCVICGKNATATEELSYRGERFRLRLCDPHGDELQYDIYSWTRVAELVTRQDDLRLVAERAQVVRHMKAVAPEKLVKPAWEAEAEHARLNQVRLRWNLSQHAWKDRLEGRARQYGFDVYDVLRALDSGSYYEEIGALGLGRYVRDKVSVLVDVDKKVVVTIEPNLQVWGKDLDALLKGA